MVQYRNREGTGGSSGIIHVAQVQRATSVVYNYRGVLLGLSMAVLVAQTWTHSSLRFLQQDSQTCSRSLSSLLSLKRHSLGSYFLPIHNKKDNTSNHGLELICSSLCNINKHARREDNVHLHRSANFTNFSFFFIMHQYHILILK